MKKSYFFIALIAFVAMATVSCGKKESKIYPVKMGDYWGYVTNTGKYLVNPSFETAGFFHCGLARIVKDGKVGYINTKGKIVITPKYEDGTDFTEGRAFVVMEGESPVCINTSEKIQYTCPDWVETVFTYNDHFAKMITVDNNVTYINRTGDETISRVQQGLIFSEGLAYVYDTSSVECKSFYINEKGMHRISLNQENWVTYYQSYQNNSNFSEGMAAVKGKNGKYGYIDNKGTLTIDLQFEEAFLFSEGVALVKIGGKYGYINNKGTFVINPQFTSARSFKGGMAAIKQGDTWGYINMSGTIVVNPTYSAACDFIGGYAMVMQEDKIGIIDQKGEMVVTPQFDSAWLSVEGAMERSVSSRKFTGDSFIPAFLSRYDNGAWDGITASTTLGDIRAKYKGAIAEGDDQFVCKTSFEPIDGIALTQMAFGFDEKTYKMVDNYVSNFFWTYKSGKKRQYNNALKVSSIVYTFTLNGEMKNKTFSVAKALAEGLAEKMGAVINNEYDGYQLDGVGFMLTRNEEEVAGVVYDKSQGIIYAMVGCE